MVRHSFKNEMKFDRLSPSKCPEHAFKRGEVNLCSCIEIRSRARYEAPNAKQVAHMQRGPSMQQKKAIEINGIGIDGSSTKGGRYR
jgi:hypothetical protein